MATGFYGQYFDPNPRINEMMRHDLMRQQMQYMPPMNISQEYFRGYDMTATTYTKPHFCNPVPENLKSYYHQLLEYHKQAGFKRKECEELCCALKRLGIKY